MRKLLTLSALLLLLASAAHAQTVQNPSFEVNAVMTAPDTGGGPWSGAAVSNWARGGFSAGLWQPAPAVFASLPDGKTIAWVDSWIAQDLGVAAQPNTTYTLSVFVGHEADRAGSYSLSILAGGTVACTSTGSALGIPLGTFAQITLPCVIGATALAGNLSLKLASADGSHQLFDSVSLTSAPNAPPPVFQTMTILGGVRYCTLCDKSAGDDSIAGLNLLAGLRIVIMQLDASGASLGSVSYIMDSNANISGADAFTINASFPLHFFVGVYMPNGTPVQSLAQRIDVDPIHLQGQGTFHIVIRLDVAKPVVVRGVDWWTGQ